MKFKLSHITTFTILLCCTIVVGAAEQQAAASITRPDNIIRFAAGEYPIVQNTTFNDAVVFEPGAHLNIQAGAVVKFEKGFTAGEWCIFGGKGTIANVKKLIPEWFGATGDGIADDTEALQRTFNSCKEPGFGPGGNYILLTRTYLVGSLNINTSGLTINAENAWLIAKASGQYPHLLRFTKSFCKITGNLTIDGNYNLGYDCIINVNSRHFISNNVVIWRASLPWLFGNRQWATSGIPGDAEKGDSEIEIIGGATAHCLRGAEAVGANTIALFSSALIYSYPWTLPKGDPRKAAWEAADSTLVRCIGGLVYFTGGGLANFSNKVPLIEVQPIRCTKPQYYSTYGGVYISNAHIESGNFLATANPNKIHTQDSKGVKTVQRMASLNMQSCGGYVTGNNIPINTDPLFTGRLIVKNCNFYGINRTANLAKIGNPAASIDIDDISFNDDHPKGAKAVIIEGAVKE